MARGVGGGGKVFKQLFVLHAGSTILAPLLEHKIRYNLLPVVIGVITLCHFLLLQLHRF